MEVVTVTGAAGSIPLIVVFASDTHMRHAELPSVEEVATAADAVLGPDAPVVVVHGGDATNSGELDEIADVVEWLNALGAVFGPRLRLLAWLPGNHDRTLSGPGIYTVSDDDAAAADAFVTRAFDGELLRGAGTHCVALDDAGTAQLRVVYASMSPSMLGHTLPSPADIAAAAAEAAAADETEASTTTLWLSHEPPHGTLDCTAHGRAIGSRAIADAIATLSPHAVLCGHVHDSRGTPRLYLPP
ncbi:uncharacterized protein AMSG_03780 [Thecamonas trahens ATCC 50062]|uniref:Calcineurin-like phosphoesterase domain-containing protein n=1 Tax=Thecamonas trahens ATCC 50062 TaxID=461836 RepID=A0A0L0D5H9_THETB|nr:hypothetical protein AMSG_03780 [Thecamonas trahens ATCC 50062]KNC47346.1 hypothetical protein AMSG_03780 [Thecamonas trahens ATCC 50062]|eukprot:XP_013759684.1 hypothetical protein AMSG_03780 [Thecamonas trahens ATCC 50062]